MMENVLLHIMDVHVFRRKELHFNCVQYLMTKYFMSVYDLVSELKICLTILFALLYHLANRYNENEFTLISGKVKIGLIYKQHSLFSY